MSPRHPISSMLKQTSRQYTHNKWMMNSSMLKRTSNQNTHNKRMMRPYGIMQLPQQPVHGNGIVELPPVPPIYVNVGQHELVIDQFGSNFELMEQLFLHGDEGGGQNYATTLTITTTIIQWFKVIKVKSVIPFSEPYTADPENPPPEKDYNVYFPKLKMA